MNEETNAYKILSIRNNLTQVLDHEGITLEEKDLIQDSLDLLATLKLAGE